MKTYFRAPRLLLAALGLSGALLAEAQTTNLIVSTDFDSVTDQLTGVWGGVYCGSDAGAAVADWTPNPVAISPGEGVGNSAALAIHQDFSYLASDPNYVGSHAYTYASTSLGMYFGSFSNSLAPATNGCVTLFKFDAAVKGLLPGQLSAPASFGPTYPYDGSIEFDSGGVPVFVFLSPQFNLSSNFNTFSLSLADCTLESGNASDLTNAAVMASLDALRLDFRCTAQVGTVGVDIQPIFGFDNDNDLVLDNISLSQSFTTVVAGPKIEQVIYQADFDTNQPATAYPFIFRDGANSATVILSTNLTGGAGGTAALQGTADLTSWSGTPPTSYSGFGIGVSGTNSSPLPSSDKSTYRVYVTAKGAGFLPGVTSASGVMGIQFMVPPGTLMPSNAAPAVVLELAPTLTLTSNYQAFVFDGATSPIGIYSGGSQAMFNQYYTNVNAIQVQAQFNGSPDLGSIFGYDGNNAMFFDNIKVVELVPGFPPVSITRTGTQIKVYWTDPATGGTAKLQSATSLLGPWTDVLGAASGSASPYTVPSGSSQLFFRSAWVPGT
jgi:hypothetical protein